MFALRRARVSDQPFPLHLISTLRDDRTYGEYDTRAKDAKVIKLGMMKNASSDTIFSVIIHELASPVVACSDPALHQQDASSTDAPSSPFFSVAVLL